MNNQPLRNTDPAKVPEYDPDFERYVRDNPKVTYVHPDDSWPRAKLIRSFEALCGSERLDSVYRELKRDHPNPKDFFRAALGRARIETQLVPNRLPEVPTGRPLVIVANHPFGIVDGLVLIELALALRGDFRLVLNALLCQDGDLLPHFLPVDFSETRDAQKVNIRTKRLALDALDQDVPLILFPGGGVATANRLGFGRLVEFPWTTFVAKLVLQAQADVLPVYFPGRNSRLFHIASHIGEPLRLALLIHETLRKFETTLRLEVGPLLPHEQLAGMNRRELTEHLEGHCVKPAHRSAR